jgi:hypothetical protein
MNSPFLFHATNGRLGKYLLGRSSHPLSGQDPRAQADDGAHQRSASEGRNKRRRRGMKKRIKVARQHSWLETGTLPSPCIPARKQRPGRAKGAAKEVTRAGRRPLKVNRKRINAAVWHDFPRVGHEARRAGSSICRPPVTRPLVSATLVLVAPEKGPVWLSSRRRRNGRETSEP